MTIHLVVVKIFHSKQHFLTLFFYSWRRHMEKQQTNKNSKVVFVLEEKYNVLLRNLSCFIYFQKTRCPLCTCYSSALLWIQNFDAVSQCCLLWLSLFSIGRCVLWIINAHHLSSGVSLPFNFTLHLQFRLNHFDSSAVIQADDSALRATDTGDF